MFRKNNHVHNIILKTLTMLIYNVIFLYIWFILNKLFHNDNVLGKFYLLYDFGLIFTLKYLTINYFWILESFNSNIWYQFNNLCEFTKLTHIFKRLFSSTKNYVVFLNLCCKNTKKNSDYKYGEFNQKLQIPIIHTNL